MGKYVIDMARPTARVLALLEILESGGLHTVADLARRLEVDERTVRRYASHLLELGVPVEAVRGRYGGYRLAAGYRMPPLMLSDEEALALLLGIIAARHLGLIPNAAHGESATAKLRRVLPAATAQRLDALVETLEVTASMLGAATAETETGTLLHVADAIRQRRPLAITYISRDGTRTERTLLPYGVVAHSGRWYAVGDDSRSGQIRTFRLDRIVQPVVRAGTFDVPAGFDPAARLLEGLAATPWRHQVSVQVAGPLEAVRSHFPAGVAQVYETEDPGWVLVRIRAERLDWLPPLLASLDRPIRVQEPEQLRRLVHALATRLADSTQD